jgi:ferredoxin
MDSDKINFYRKLINEVKTEIDTRNNCTMRPSEVTKKKDSQSAELFKQLQKLGIQRYGVTKVNNKNLFKNNKIPENHTRVIVIVENMDFDKMRSVPCKESAEEIMRVYHSVGLKVLLVQKLLQSMGYEAMGHHPLGDLSEYHHLLIPPHAYLAGLGERGRTGLFIDFEYGSLVRLGAVTTNVNIETNKPIDRGITEFCKRCIYCANKCPVNALPFETTNIAKLDYINNIDPELVFKVNGDRCIKYFQKHAGCGICIHHCVINKRDKLETKKRVERIENWYLEWILSGRLLEEKTKLLKT